MVVKMSRGRERETGQTDVTTNVHTRRKKLVAHQQIHNPVRAPLCTPREHEYCVYALLRGAGGKKAVQTAADRYQKLFSDNSRRLSLPFLFYFPSLFSRPWASIFSLSVAPALYARFLCPNVSTQNIFCMSGMGVSLAHPVIHYFIHKHDKEARTFINVCHLIKIIPRPMLPAKNAKLYSYLSDRSISPLSSFYIQTDSFWLWNGFLFYSSPRVITFSQPRPETLPPAAIRPSGYSFLVDATTTAFVWRAGNGGGYL